ncbi:MAG: hypothetical protein OXI17_00735 [Gammaproteobacteria bacterium]|nr:hypothetical protein [Gammaproteobacteria bacterium]
MARKIQKQGASIDRKIVHTVLSLIFVMSLSLTQSQTANAQTANPNSILAACMLVYGAVGSIAVDACVKELEAAIRALEEVGESIQIESNAESGPPNEINANPDSITSGPGCGLASHTC